MVDSERESDFPALLDKLQAPLEARFQGHVVAIGRDEAPAPVPVIVPGVGDETVENAIRAELGNIDLEWSLWAAVER